MRQTNLDEGLSLTARSCDKMAIMVSVPKIAIIGTGISGLACASQLHNLAEISLFDKSRGVTGRLATRRSDDFSFDHGAGYFSADADFAQWLAPLKARNVVQQWDAVRVRLSDDAKQQETLPSHDMWVASPGMSALGRAMIETLKSEGSDRLDVHLDTPITRIEPTKPGGHRLYSEGAAGQVEASFGPFDQVILAMPPAQASALLPADSPLRDACARVKMLPCHSLMLGFETAPNLGWDMAYLEDPILHLIYAMHPKPGRDGKPRFVIQSTYAWSQTQLEKPAQEVGDQMAQRLGELGLLDAAQATYTSSHRWLYAAAQKPLANSEPHSQGYLLDASAGIGVIGDWCLGDRVRHGFASGMALGQALAQASGGA